jgi:Domain of unknown function (DUF1961)
VLQFRGKDHGKKDIGVWMKNSLFDLNNVNSLENWFLEGDGEAKLTTEKEIRLTTIDTGKKWPATPPSCTLWYRSKLPESYSITFDFLCESGAGCNIVFIDAQAVNNSDIFSWSRSGGWEGYAFLRRMKMYTMSFNRIESEGVNMRKLWAPEGNDDPNPLISQNSIDPCGKINTSYHMVIEKQDGRIQFIVDDQVIHDYRDDGTFGPPLNGGHFAIRNFRHPKSVLISNLKIASANSLHV